MRNVRALVVAAASIGVLIGIGGYTFVYARGYSYLTDDPVACANCHIMQDHYAAWSRSSHAAIAACNDCHTPPGLVPKYLTKAQNGFWHSFYFTTGTYADPLRITARNRDVTERACRVCHATLTDSIEPPHDALIAGTRERTSCLRCHETVGHLE